MLRSEKLLQNSWMIFAILALAIFGLYRIQFGLDLTDEGMYVSAPLRYALGDLPFRDEIMNPHRHFDVLLWPIFSLFPDITLYSLRVLGLLIQLASILGFYCVLQRFCPRYLAATTAIATAFLMTRVWTPGYNLLGAHFFFLAISLWMLACLSERVSAGKVLAILGATAFALACMSFGPLALLFAVPLLVVFAAKLRPEKFGPYAPASRTFVTAVICLLGVLGLTYLSTGLLGDLLNSHQRLTSMNVYGRGILPRVDKFLVELRACIPFILLVIAYLSGLAVLCRASLFQNKWLTAGLAVVSAAVTIVCVQFYPHFNPRGERFHVEYCLLAAALATCVVAFVCKFLGLNATDDKESSFRLVSFVLLSCGLFYAVLGGLISGNGFLNATYATAPLLCIGVVRLGYRSGEENQAFRFALCGFCIGLAYVNLMSVATHAYREDAPQNLTARFTQPLLQGIYSTPRRVASIEQTVRFLSAHVSKGEYLLAYDECPMLYYLTQTRPATHATWPTKTFSAWVRQDGVDYLKASDRMPEYAVRCIVHGSARDEPGRGALPFGLDVKSDPMHTFVYENFVPWRNFYPYQVWRSRQFVPDVNNVVLLEDGFMVWDAEEAIPPAQLATTAQHLRSYGVRGDFLIERRQADEGDFLSVRYTGSSGSARPILALAYTLEAMNTENKVVEIFADLAFHGEGEAHFFFQDSTADGAMRFPGVEFVDPEWRRVGFDAQGRAGSKTPAIGIEFRPEKVGDELLLRNVKISSQSFIGDA